MDSYYLDEPLKEVDFVITAFQTAGYISFLAVKYLEEQKVIKDIGGINLDSMREFGDVSDGFIQSPIRILSSGSAIFIASQFPLMQSAVEGLVGQISSICKKLKPKKIIALDGINADSAREGSQVYYASNDSKLKIDGAKKLEEGAIIGVNAHPSFMTKELGIPMAILMAETHSSIPDGIAASALISVLSQMIGIKVDTSKLVSEYKKTINKINELLKRVQRPKQSEDTENMYG